MARDKVSLYYGTNYYVPLSFVPAVSGGPSPSVRYVTDTHASLG
jgi:hypothetical protein